jgi:hypothetical protein
VVVALIACLLASAPTPPDEERSIAGAWVQLAPLGFALPSPGGSDVERLRRAVRSGFRWGFSAGVSFEPARHLFISASAGFDQTLWIFRNVERDGYELCFRGDCYGWDERGVGHLMRVGPELRLGWTSRRVLAWAMLAGQLGISRIRLDCNNSVEPHCDRVETDLGPGIGGGLGLAIRATSRAAFGLEGSVDHTWLDPRDDPFRAVRTIELALIVALQF